MHMYMYISTNLIIKIFSQCYINIDVCAKAMEPAITTPTLHQVAILGTTTICFPYLKKIFKNHL